MKEFRDNLIKTCALTLAAIVTVCSLAINLYTGTTRNAEKDAYEEIEVSGDVQDVDSVTFEGALIMTSELCGGARVSWWVWTTLVILAVTGEEIYIKSRKKTDEPEGSEE